MFQVPAWTEINIDVTGLHYNRKNYLPQQIGLGCLQRISQHDIGKIRLILNQKGSWVNGTRMRLSRSPWVQGLASVAGALLASKISWADVSDQPYRFFETSSLTMLTILIQHFKVEPHPKFSGESFDRLKEKIGRASYRERV